MQCPVCIESQLVMTERQGIEVDYCPRCRGVWLDRGELDKIIERVSVAGPASAPSAGAPGAVPGQWKREEPTAPPVPRGYAPRRDYDDDDDDDYRRDHGYGRRRKRGGFLGELFDFD